MSFYRWLKHVYDNVAADDTEDMEYSWAAFHANRLEGDSDTLLDISSLLPIFQEEAKSVAMIRHAMNVIMSNVNFLNPGQLPVITCDQPLYAIAKLVQWNWSDRFSEKRIVILFGGLHIQIAALRTIGDWLDNSGWTSALSQANIASSGTADSFLKASHVSRTRHAHEVTASALYILMKRSYSMFMEERDSEEDQPVFEEWIERREIERAIGLTENMTQLQRWMVSGPEIARVINEFESAQERIKKDQSKGPDLRHHEQFDDESIWKEKDWRMGTRYHRITFYLPNPQINCYIKPLDLTILSKTISDLVRKLLPIVVPISFCFS
ncbi:Hypothetical predicted protein, partial [Mytilus galloprovincialis]